MANVVLLSHNVGVILRATQIFPLIIIISLYLTPFITNFINSLPRCFPTYSRALCQVTAHNRSAPTRSHPTSRRFSACEKPPSRNRRDGCLGVLGWRDGLRFATRYTPRLFSSGAQTRTSSFISRYGSAAQCRADIPTRARALHTPRSRIARARISK